jgi:23S rRNA (adenine-N6)-dimethyltransferase
MPKKGNCPGAGALGISQNFFTSARLTARILDKTDININDHVFEIGAGTGSITRVLAEKCGILTACELDPALYEKLEKRLDGITNVRLIKGDFFKIPLPAGNYKIFANIPFSRTTDIITRLCENKNPPLAAWLFLEKGAAKRFCGTPVETAASIMLKTVFDAKIVHSFNRYDFHPSPAADVVLLRLLRKEVPDISAWERKIFAGFVAAGTKRGSEGIKCFFTHAGLKTALRSANLTRDFTPGEVSYVQWLCLFRGMRVNNPHLFGKRR